MNNRENICISDIWNDLAPYYEETISYMNKVYSLPSTQSNYIIEAKNLLKELKPLASTRKILSVETNNTYRTANSKILALGNFVQHVSHVSPRQVETGNFKTYEVCDNTWVNTLVVHKKLILEGCRRTIRTSLKKFIEVLEENTFSMFTQPSIIFECYNENESIEIFKPKHGQFAVFIDGKELVFPRSLTIIDIHLILETESHIEEIAYMCKKSYDKVIPYIENDKKIIKKLREAVIADIVINQLRK